MSTGAVHDIPRVIARVHPPLFPANDEDYTGALDKEGADSHALASGVADMTVGNTPRGPRSAQKRGPKAASAPARDVLTEQARGTTPVPEGGFPPDDADRHLLNYHSRFLAEDRSDTYFRTTRALVVAARRWRKVANERVKSLGQTMARWETLFLVGFSGEELTQSQLARLISVEGPTMVRMLDVLARDGLIERQQSGTDRRVTTNRITPKGTQVIGDIMDVTNALREELLREIDPEKLAVANDVLGQILSKLDTMR